MSLEKIGQELKKIYTFEKIAKNIGKSSSGGKALRLTSLLAGGGGAALGGVPGAVGGLVVNEALSSPTGTRLISKGLEKGLGPAISNVGSALGSSAVRQGVMGATMYPQELQTPEMLPTPQGVQGTEPTITPQVTTTTNGVQTGGLQTPTTQKTVKTLTGYTPEQLYAGAMKAYRAGDKSSYSQLKSMYDDETAYQKANKKDTGKGNVSASIDMMEKLYSPGTTGSLSAGTKTVGLAQPKNVAKIAYKKFTDQDYVDRLNSYKTQMALVAGAINQAAGAGVLNGGEYQRLAMESFPNEYTSEAVAQAWFKNARTVLDSLPPDRAAELSSYLEGLQ